MSLWHLLTWTLNTLPFEQSTSRRFVHSCCKACTVGLLPSFIQLRKLWFNHTFLVTHGWNDKQGRRFHPVCHWHFGSLKDCETIGINWCTIPHSGLSKSGRLWKPSPLICCVTFQVLSARYPPHYSAYCYNRPFTHHRSFFSYCRLRFISAF